MRLSIVVPALDEERQIEETLRRVREAGDCEIVVVDGGSSDRTVERARAFADQVIRTRRGRAVQMNAGARAAAGDVLLFLHADTRLPNGFADAIEARLADPRVAGGRFDVRLEPSSRLLWLTGALMNHRSRLSRISTGDQAIFVRRPVFERLGGFPEMPLMEDIAFSRKLKRAGRVACLRLQVVTSSRRWRADGVVRTILLMWSMRALYFFGLSPERLRRLYHDRR